MIVTQSQAVVLTHVSPYLYNDPDVDIDALLDVLKVVGCDMSVPTGGSLPSLRQIIAHLSRRPENGKARCTVVPEDLDRTGAGVRYGAILGAIVAAILGAALAWGLWRLASRAGPQRAAMSDVWRGHGELAYVRGTGMLPVTCATADKNVCPTDAACPIKALAESRS